MICLEGGGGGRDGDAVLGRGGEGEVRGSREEAGVEGRINDLSEGSRGDTASFSGLGVDLDAAVPAAAERGRDCTGSCCSCISGGF